MTYTRSDRQRLTRAVHDHTHQRQCFFTRRSRL